jgi:peptide chain release factor subunit 1
VADRVGDHDVQGTSRIAALGKESALMATTVTLQTLRELAAFRAENGCAISFYLNLDPSIAPTAGDADTRINALLSEGEKSDWAHRGDLTHSQRQGLKSDFQRIRTFFDSEFAREGARGAAVFAAGPDNYWLTLDLPAPVSDQVKVRSDFRIAPLVPFLTRGDGALVAVVGREQGSVYRVADGRLEEVLDRTEEQPGRHDQGGWSQANYQRHIEKLVQDHLRGVAQALDRRVRLGSLRLVVVGSDETRAEFLETLSGEARSAVVGTTQADAHATPAELLELVTPILENANAAEESAVLERWREEAGRNGRASSGWSETIEAASDGRVELLLFHEGSERPAWECPKCGRGSVEGGNCPLDGTRLEPRAEGLDLTVHHTLAHGGAVWAVRHHRDLDPVEGIGALLRY